MNEWKAIAVLSPQSHKRPSSTVLMFPSRLPISPSFLLRAAPSHVNPAPPPGAELKVGMRERDGPKLQENADAGTAASSLVPGLKKSL